MSVPSWLKQRNHLLLLGLIVLAALLRFATLGLQSYDHDETVTAGKILQPHLGETLSRTLSGERSPPLYYILAWGWSRVFGTGELALRSISAIAGTLTVPVSYATAKALVSRRAGLMTAALVAVNPDLIWYSQQARSYSTFILLAALSLYFFARAIQEPAARAFAWWALTSSLAVATHYFAAFLIVPEGLWLLYVSRPRRAALAAVGATAAVGAALLPLAVMQQGTGRRDTFVDVPLGERTLVSVAKFVTGEQPAGGSPALDLLQRASFLATLVLVVVAVVVAWRGGDRRSSRALLLVGSVALAGVALPVVLAVVGVDFVKPRNLLGAVVPLMAVVAIGIAAWRARGAAVAVVVALGATLLAVTVVTDLTPGAQRFDWRGVAALVGRPSGPRVLASPRSADDPLIFYLGTDPVLVFSKKQRAEHLPGGGSVTAFRSAEIVVLGPRGTDASPQPGFRLADRQMLGRLVISHWRAPRPASIDLAALNRSEALSRRHSILVDGVGAAGE